MVVHAEQKWISNHHQQGLGSSDGHVEPGNDNISPDQNISPDLNMP